MPIESPVNSISDLNVLYPEHTDGYAQTDSHIRLVKSALQLTFPNVKGPVSASNTDLANGYVMVGGIIIYSGAIADIPSNWQLCDGTNGTPDLRDKFIVGAGNNYTVGATGGATSFSGTSNADGAHTHQSTATSASTSASSSTSTATSSAVSSSTSSADSQGAHTHPGSSALGHALSIAELPPHQHNVSVAVGGGNGGPQSGQYNATLGPTNFVTDGGIGLAGNAHTHGIGLVSDGSHSHNVSTTTVTTVSTNVNTTTLTNTNTATTVTTPGSSDSNHAHAFALSNVVPPYYALAFIRRMT